MPCPGDRRGTFRQASSILPGQVHDLLQETMEFHIVPMNAEYSQAIAAWHYEGIYAFYDLCQDPDDLSEFLDARQWEGRYFAVLDDRHELVGYFSFEEEGEGVNLGLGLAPGHTGRGLGIDFCQAGLEFARQRYHPVLFRLQVATFNQRAIRVYARAGFKAGRIFMNRTNGGEYEFVQMEREA